MHCTGQDCQGRQHRVKSTYVGCGVGAAVGLGVGVAVGAAVGLGVGATVGLSVGAAVGLGVGAHTRSAAAVPSCTIPCPAEHGDHGAHDGTLPVLLLN